MVDDAMSEQAKGILLLHLSHVLEKGAADKSMRLNFRIPGLSCYSERPERVITGFLPASRKEFGETLVLYCDEIKSPAARVALFDILQSFFSPPIMGWGKFWVGADKLNEKIVFVRFDVENNMPSHDDYSFVF